MGLDVLFINILVIEGSLWFTGRRGVSWNKTFV